MGRIAILSSGLWRLKADIRQLTGMQPVRLNRFTRLFAPRTFAFVAGWGLKPTADKARVLAQSSETTYMSIEDGFLRSVCTGPRERPLSLVTDRTGVHYDATRPSDLERIVAECSEPISENALARARAGIARLRSTRISKYNAGPFLTPGQMGLGPRPAGGRVLVVDQTVGDGSIAYGLADASSFTRMLEAALAENPAAEIIVKTHPEVITGAKAGYLSAAAGSRIRLVAQHVNPWSLIEAADRVYVVTSQLGLEALIAGKPVSCFGAPFYAGWGLTDDRVAIPRRTARPTLEQLFTAIYFRYSRYLDPYTRCETTFERTIDSLVYLRDRYLANADATVGIGITLWKRAVIDRVAGGFGGAIQHAWTIAGAVRRAKEQGARIVTWASRSSKKLETACARNGVPLVRIEDGFIRSVGLGAAYVPGASFAVDGRGVHYDATRPSDLEHLLETAVLPPDLLRRAIHLRQAIVRHGLTKYNVGSEAAGCWSGSGGRTRILVPGQVETDASVKAARALGFETRRFEGVNLALLRAVRERNPEAFILYKAHPDVAANLRWGFVPEHSALRYADKAISHGSIVKLIEECDRVETLSSLTGFEALLRGKAVTTHALPFYAGWGLTRDLMSTPRRTRRLTLDELVAVSLILYPRYVHPETLLPCEPEVVVSYLAGQLGGGAAGESMRVPAAAIEIA